MHRISPHEVEEVGVFRFKQTKFCKRLIQVLLKLKIISPYMKLVKVNNFLVYSNHQIVNHIDKAIYEFRMYTGGKQPTFVIIGKEQMQMLLKEPTYLQFSGEHFGERYKGLTIKLNPLIDGIVVSD